MDNKPPNEFQSGECQNLMEFIFLIIVLKWNFVVVWVFFDISLWNRKSFSIPDCIANCSCCISYSIAKFDKNILIFLGSRCFVEVVWNCIYGSFGVRDTSLFWSKFCSDKLSHMFDENCFIDLVHVFIIYVFIVICDWDPFCFIERNASGSYETVDVLIEFQISTECMYRGKDTRNTIKLICEIW